MSNFVKYLVEIKMHMSIESPVICHKAAEQARKGSPSAQLESNLMFSVFRAQKPSF
jgi:hypothetical protein